MQVNNTNLNAMMQLEERLEKSANALAKLNLDNGETKHEEQKELKQSHVILNNEEKKVDIVQELVKQVEMPIAYTANAEVISVKNSIHKTLLDIKV
jgi:flagellar hook protein FlgE